MFFFKPVEYLERKNVRRISNDPIELQTELIKSAEIKIVIEEQ